MNTKFQLKISLILLVLISAVKVHGQATDTLSANAVYSEVKFRPIKPKALIVPAVFVAYGFSAPYIKVLKKLDDDTNYELREDHPKFGFHADDYLRYAPIAAVYGLDLAGVKSKHNFVDRTSMLLLSTAIAGGSTSITKKITNRTRPNGLDNHSFPSGHTSMAFMAAEFMHQEYKDQSPWYSIMGYSVAVTTATLRLYNGAHWFSDVVAGAGYGILSTKISYWAYPFIKDKLFHDKATHTVLVPFHQEGHTGLTFVRKL